MFWYDPSVHTVWEPTGRYEGELCEQGSRTWKKQRKRDVAQSSAFQLETVSFPFLLAVARRSGAFAVENNCVDSATPVAECILVPRHKHVEDCLTTRGAVCAVLVFFAEHGAASKETGTRLFRANAQESWNGQDCRRDH